MNPLIDEVYDFLKSKGYSYPPYLHGKVFNGHVPYSGPVFDETEIKAALESILFSKWLVAGEKVMEFEKVFSKEIGCKESVMVNSGSSANLLMLAALKKRFGWVDTDEIIVSVVGFPSTLSAITINNLKPRFADIEMRTLNFDLEQVEKAINSNTKAIFVSPVLGNPPDMDELVRISNKYGVMLIGDCCDSLGTKWNNKSLQDYFIASSCSFFPAHHLVSYGQGGMVSSNDIELIDIARRMSTWSRACYCRGIQNLSLKGMCGKRFSNWLPSQPDLVVDHKYVYSESNAMNLQPLEIQGAVGLAQIKKISDFHAKRIVNKQRISDFFSKIPGLNDVFKFPKAEVSWFGTPVIADTQKLKMELVAHLEKNSVQCRNYFSGNILLHEGYSHLGDWRDYSNANEVLRRVFFVGAWPGYTEEHFNHIESTLKSFIA